MSQVTLETILAQVSQLPLSEREQLRALLTDQLRTKGAGEYGATAERKSPAENVVNAAIQCRDRSQENRWLAQHGREYIDEWVLLEGDRLITHSRDALEVYAAAQAAGIEIPYIIHVEDPDHPVLIGW
jgi:hypothetical protein